MANYACHPVGVGKLAPVSDKVFIIITVHFKCGNYDDYFEQYLLEVCPNNIGFYVVIAKCCYRKSR